MFLVYLWISTVKAGHNLGLIALKLLTHFPDCLLIQDCGIIQSYHGTYYVEPAERYLEGKDVPFHSVIYHEDDIRESTATSATQII